tara:strand:+ start:237 stop:536 length:300 start_codon:yes stop_codon:yes gene_type:complete
MRQKHIVQVTKRHCDQEEKFLDTILLNQKEAQSQEEILLAVYGIMIDPDRENQYGVKFAQEIEERGFYNVQEGDMDEPYEFLVRVSFCQPRSEYKGGAE